MSVYIVTGASKGLGLAIVKEIIQLGGLVVGLARSESLLSQVQQELGQDKFQFVAGDITNSQINQKTVDAASKWGPLKGIVHNAGVIGPIETLAKVDLEGVKKTMDINLFSIIDLTQKAIPHLVPNNGNIILISSGAASKGYEGWGSYCLSKAALNMLGMLLAAEHPNLRTLSVRPGVIDTDMQVEVREKGSNNMTPEMYKKFKDLKDNNELLDPKIPGAAIAKMVTGEIPAKHNGTYVNWDAYN